MSVHAVSSPAADRARRAATGTVLAGLALVLGLVAYVRGVTAGVAVVLLALLAGYVLLNRFLGLRVLAGLSGTTVGEVGRALPIIRTGMPSGALLAAISDLQATDHCLVHDGERWLVLTKGVVVETVLSSSGDIDVARLGRRAPVLSPRTPLDRLPRMPYAEEVWLVADGDPPRALHRHDLLRAGSSSGAPSGGPAREVHRQPASPSGDVPAGRRLAGTGEEAMA